MTIQLDLTPHELHWLRYAVLIAYNAQKSERGAKAVFVNLLWRIDIAEYQALKQPPDESP